MKNLTNEKIEKRIDSLMANMSLEEKVGQLHSINYGGEFTDKMKEWLKKGRTGAMLLVDNALAGEAEAVRVSREKINEMRRFALENSPSKIPLLTCRDVIHGMHTTYPIPLAQASAFNPEMVRECYRATGEEAKAYGVDVSFAPMLDVSRDPRWGRCIEGPGEDPYVGEVMAKAIVDGFQDGDLSKDTSLGACAKHFVGYGASEGGRDYNRTEISEYTLRNVYLRAFRSAAESGIASAMSSFNEISGVPATANRHTMQEILKDEFGFEGFVIADWLAIYQLIRQGVAEDIAEAAALAKNAGLDMDMADDAFGENLVALVNGGKVSEDIINDAVRRVLRVKFALGYFDKDPCKQEIKYNMDEHRALARRMAGECMVLLKNENATLPLSKDTPVYVCGPYAFDKRIINGSWAADGDLSYSVSVADGMSAKSDKVYFSNDRRELSVQDEILRFAPRNGKQTVVVVLGESDKVTGENHSVESIEISAGQVDLVKRLKRMGNTVVGVVLAGRPLALTEAEPYLDAILWGWHSGCETGNAVADIIYGDVNPSGKLAMTLPATTGQIPLYYNVTMSGRTSDAYYGGRFVNGDDEKIYGYNNMYDDMSACPLYHFGYGLSYTTFEYGAPVVDTAELSLDQINSGKAFTVKVKVKNTGNREGKETVMCFIRDKVASMMRPIRELCAFEKVTLGAGEEREVEFTLGFNQLSFYNAENKRVVEPGKFEIYTGADCYAEGNVNVKVI